MKLKFKQLYDEGPRPVLVNFENGTLNENSNEKIVTKVLKNTSTENADLHVAVATESILYDGIVNSDAQSSLYNTFIGVRDKLTKKVKLYAVDTVTLSPFKKQKMVDEEEPTDKSKDNSRLDKINRLSKLFGSKKLVRTVEARERIKVNVEAIKDHLEKTIQETSVTESDAMPLKREELSTVVSYLPPINRDAASADEVYKLYDFITPIEIESLRSQAETTLEADFENINCCPYVAEEIAKLQSSSCSLPKESKIKRCCVWLYIDHLIYFIKESAKNIQKRGYSACSYSEQIDKKILNSFTINGPNGRNRPMVMRDKCFCYILVLILLNNLNNIIDIETLSVALRTPMSKLKQICQAIAAKPIGTGGSKDLYSVNLPLPPIPSSNKHMKKSARR